MAIYIDRAGTFRGIIQEYGAKQNAKTGTWSLNIRAQLNGYYNPDSEQWEDWREYQIEANGYLNIIKKDGTWNEAQLSTIMPSTGWNGSFASLDSQAWKPRPCQFDIKLNDYDNTFRIEWLAPFDRVPGQLGNLDSKTAKEMDDKLHGSLKAIIGNAKRQEKKPEGGPVPPPSITTPKPPSEEIPTDDLPF